MPADEERRRILTLVAEGKLTPSEAAERLDAIDNPPPPPPPPPPPHPPEVGPATPEQGSIRRVRVEGTFRSMEVVGDRDVRTAVATGSHDARQEGDTLVIDGGRFLDDDDDDDDDGNWFWFDDRRRHHGVRVRTRSGVTLQVRMNPDLELDAKVEAGPLRVRDVKGPIRARVAAGPLTITGFASPIDVKVSAGTVKARGVLDSGESRVECEAGSVNIHLEHGSSVRIEAEAHLGKVNLPGPASHRHHRHGRDFDDWRGWTESPGALGGLIRSALGNREEATVGGGAGRLDVEVSMGSCHVSSAERPGDHGP